MQSTMERRFRPSKLEVRAGSKDGAGALSGYAACFNCLSDDLGGFKERLAPGCFDRALRENHDVRMLVNHSPSEILGRTTNGTLQLGVDQNGLKFRCELPDTSFARDIFALVSRGDLTQCSFGFQVREQDWSDELDEDEDGESRTIMIRIVRDLNLLDASVVTYAAYPQTSVSAVDPVALLGRSFPEGVPVEVRSRLEGKKDLQKFDTRNGKKARRRLFDFVVR